HVKGSPEQLLPGLLLLVVQLGLGLGERLLAQLSHLLETRVRVVLVLLEDRAHLLEGFLDDRLDVALKPRSVVDFRNSGEVLGATRQDLSAPVARSVCRFPVCRGTVGPSCRAGDPVCSQTGHRGALSRPSAVRRSAWPRPC